MAVSTRVDSVDVAVVVIAEATAIEMAVIEAAEEVASRVVDASEAVAVVVVVVAVRNVKETGPAASAAIRTLPGETSATGVRLRRVMVPPEGEAGAVLVEAVVAVEDRSEAANVTAAAVVEVLVEATVMEDMAVMVVVPCVEATETGISDNGRTKPELLDISH